MTEEERDAMPGNEPGAGETGASELGPMADAPEADAGAPGEAASPGGGPPEVDIYKDRWLRSEAELQNFRRRALKEREEAVTRAQDFVLLDVIGLLDDLERALASLTPEHAAEAWVQGVALTAQRMRDTLARWDVVETEALGRPFDPGLHEAILEVDAPAGVAPGAIAQVVLKGYRRGPRTLRAARVVVARVSQESA